MIGANICQANFEKSFVKNLNIDSTIKVLNGHTFIVNSVSFSPCGKYIVSGSGNYIKSKTLIQYFYHVI
jgi:WD40 repeat protein